MAARSINCGGIVAAAAISSELHRPSAPRLLRVLTHVSRIQNKSDKSASYVHFRFDKLFNRQDK